MACNNQHKSQPDNLHLYRACQSHHNPDNDQHKPGHQQGRRSDSRIAVDHSRLAVDFFCLRSSLSNAWLPST